MYLSQCYMYILVLSLATLHMHHTIILVLIFILCRRSVLRKWKEKSGHMATYRHLFDIFNVCGYEEYADIIERICCKHQSMSIIILCSYV